MSHPPTVLLSDVFDDLRPLAEEEKAGQPPTAPEVPLATAPIPIPPSPLEDTSNWDSFSSALDDIVGKIAEFEREGTGGSKAEEEEEEEMPELEEEEETTEEDRYRIIVDQLIVDPPFRILFNYTGSVEVFDQFTDDELFKRDRMIIAAILMAGLRLTVPQVQDIFFYLTEKRRMSLKCMHLRWTASEKDSEWSLWNEVFTIFRAFPHVGAAVECIFGAHMLRDEPIPEEDEALAMACGNKVYPVIDYILTKQRATVNVSAMGWLVFNTCSSSKIRRRLLEHFVATIDTIDYADAYEDDCFHPIVIELRDTKTEEERKEKIEAYVKAMWQAKQIWKVKRQEALNELTQKYPAETAEWHLPMNLQYFLY